MVIYSKYIYWKGEEKVKKAYVALISLLLLLVGCNSNVSTKPIIEEKQLDDFNLVIKTDKQIYKKEENIEIDSYLEYLGEEELQFEKIPLITIILRNKGNENIIKQVEFKDIKTTMTKGEKFTHKIVDLNLREGEYEIFVQTTPFTVGTNAYSLNTVPRVFEVK
jgi:uncharacterized lipoprotein NlpE involved in copper resistance